TAKGAVVGVSVGGYTRFLVKLPGGDGAHDARPAPAMVPRRAREPEAVGGMIVETPTPYRRRSAASTRFEPRSPPTWRAVAPRDGLRSSSSCTGSGCNSNSPARRSPATRHRPRADVPVEPENYGARMGAAADR